MNREERAKIAFHVDHTNLKKTATEADIKKLCEDAIANNTFSVCVAPYFIPFAKEQLKDSTVAVCTVIGFPNGYNTTAVKCFETEDAVKNGADEIYMVINVGWVKEQKWDELLEEIKAVKAACHGKLLKVIIETCLLTEDEKVKMCEIVSKSGADYIKTSTGFSTNGATFEDVKLMRANVGEKVLVKAAGGISGLEDAENFLAAVVCCIRRFLMSCMIL